MTQKTKKSEAIKKKKKDFDAVDMMRQIRDKMSKEIKGMSFEEEDAYLAKIIADNKLAK